MIRRSDILTGAALAMCCSLMLVAAANADTPPPPSSMAASQAEEYEELRSEGAHHPGPGPFTDAERKLVAEYQAQQSPGAPGPYTEAQRKLVESPEVQGMVDRVSSEIRATPAVVEVEASSGFDWGDAGIGAAGMLALFSIAAGSALLIGGRRRRHGVKVATH
jgi:hypothetical protein